jgi:hypothetical protein
MKNIISTIKSMGMRWAEQVAQIRKKGTSRLTQYFDRKTPRK